jgi:hypothetical protein
MGWYSSGHIICRMANSIWTIEELHLPQLRDELHRDKRGTLEQAFWQFQM